MNNISILKTHIAIFVLSIIGLIAAGTAMGALIENGAVVFIWMPILLCAAFAAALVWCLYQMIDDIVCQCTPPYSEDEEFSTENGEVEESEN